MNPFNSAIVSASNRERPLTLSFRRFALALAAFIVLPPISLAAFVLLVDPYYVFGSPSVPGMNVVRPFYELHVLAAKPYQVQRIKPAAVTLGSSRVEVGLNPRHAGWADRNVFNFGLPSASSYEVMLAFLHAAAIGQPLKQAVVGLDFSASIGSSRATGSNWRPALPAAAARRLPIFSRPSLPTARATTKPRCPPTLV